jgi:hypothetical protein
MEEEPIGNTILFRKDPLFYNVTSLKDPNLSKYSKSHKKDIISFCANLVVFLGLLAMFVLAFYAKDETTRNLLLAISIILIFIQVGISLVSYAKKGQTRTSIRPTKFVIDFYEYELYSTLFSDTKQISTYFIAYKDIKKVIFYKEYTVIYSTQQNVIVLKNEGFKSSNNKEEFASLLKRNNVLIIYDNKK